jgi:hypothetical protein
MYWQEVGGEQVVEEVMAVGEVIAAGVEEVLAVDDQTSEVAEESMSEVT